MTDKALLDLLHAGKPVVINDVLYNDTATVGSWIHWAFGIDVVGISAAQIPVAFGLVDPERTSENMSERLIAGAYFYNYVNVPPRVADDGTEVPGKYDISLCAVMTEATMQYRAAIRQMLIYPFGQLKLPRISAEIDLSNERSLHAAKVLGFVQEGIKRDMAGPGKHYGTFGLYPENCPFWTEAAE